MFVFAVGHWDGDEERYCESLTVEVDSQADAEHLAAVYRLFAGAPDAVRRDRLARLADLAGRVAKEDAALEVAAPC